MAKTVWLNHQHRGAHKDSPKEDNAYGRIAFLRRQTNFEYVMGNWLNHPSNYTENYDEIDEQRNNYLQQTIKEGKYYN